METQVKSFVSNQHDLEDAAEDIHQAVGAWIIHATPDDNTEFSQLVKRLLKIDFGLAMELEAAANARVAAAMQAAFRLGFESARNPEQLLFSRD